MIITDAAPSILITVLVPVYNERGTILDILRLVRNQRVSGVEFEVLVVDDGSSDGTSQLLSAHPELYSRYIRLEPNQGKGAAVRLGWAEAKGTYILCQDADLEYDPSDYGILLEPILKHRAQVVSGSRFEGSPVTRVAYFWHLVGNKLLTLMFNVLNNTTFSDIYSGYLLVERSLVDAHELRVNGWAQQAEILSLAIQRGTRFYEVPIAYHGRTYEEGKKIRARNAFAVLVVIVLKRLRRVQRRPTPIGSPDRAATEQQ